MLPGTRMRKLRYQRRQSRAAIWALRFGVFAAVLSALGLLLHRFGKLETPDFVHVAALSGIVAIFALVCAAIGLRNLWVSGDKAARAPLGQLSGIFSFAAALFCRFPLVWLATAL